MHPESLAHEGQRKPPNCAWVVSDRKWDGSYPLDDYPKPWEYWIKYLTEERIKQVNEEKQI